MIFSTMLALAILGPAPETVAEPQRLTLARFSYPTFAPDGQHILYESQTDGDWDIYLMSADGLADGGGAISKLIDHESDDRMPSMSPDGRYLAFLSTREGGDFDLYLLDRESGVVRALTDNDVPEIHPYWTPDSKYVLFNRRIGDERLYDIRMIEIATDEETLLLADDELNSYSQMSPDGRYIVFDKWVENNQANGEIFVLRIADKQLTRLTNNEVYDGYPTWTRDGRILYSSEIEKDGDMKLFTIRPDGSNRRQVSFGDGNDARAAVSPDNRKIVFNRAVNDTIDIVTMPLPCGCGETQASGSR